MKFADLGLSDPLLDAIELQGYDTPSPIQEKAIPHVIAGKDVMAAAQTGTGKTAGFTLPLLHRLSNTPKPNGAGNQARALILTPTRELAAQVANSVETYGQNLKIKSAVVFGGVKINPQMQKLRGGVDVLIATPGRLLDLHNQNAIQFDKLEVLILDEADRMLDMGFIHDIKRIIKLLPKKRQTLLFSATFSEEIRQLARGIVFKPVEVSVSPPNSTVNAVKQTLIPVEKSDKSAVLTHLINENDWFQVLVFSRTKHGANRLAKQLTARNIEAAAIHGNKSQGARTRALADFKASKCRVLVATGEAVSLVSHDEFKQLVDIERLIKKEIPREELAEFPPKNNLPASKGDFRDLKPKKPKKKKPSNHNKKSPNKSGTSKDSSNKSKQSPYGAKKKSSFKKRRNANSDANGANNKRRKPSE